MGRSSARRATHSASGAHTPESAKSASVNDVATRGHSYARKTQLNEAWVRRLTSFFNEKVITLQSSEALTQPERATIAHFTVDRSDCFAFAFLAGDTGPTAALAPAADGYPRISRTRIDNWIGRRVAAR